MPGPFRLSATHLAALAGLAAFAVFSTHDVIVKDLGTRYSPVQIVFFSALLSFPLIAIIMMRDETPGTLRPVHPWWLGLRSVSGSLAGICAFFAFSLLPMSQVYAIVFASPLLITVLAIPLLGEVVRLRRGLAVAVGLIGVIVVLDPTATTPGSGHLAALAAAFFGALNSVIVRKIGRQERGVVMVLYPMMTNFILTGALLPLVYKPLPLADLAKLAVVSLLVIVAMQLLIAAYRRGDAIVVAPMQYSQIIWAAIFGALLFGEYPDTNTYAGTAIIALSGLYILRRETTGSVSRNTPVLRTRTRLGTSNGLRVGSLLRRGTGKR
ncbi:MAG: DMT family transporter [Rhodobacteraceae bacterium]|nr:DMT family transporter [Paracoccaceae bacterium]